MLKIKLIIQRSIWWKIKISFINPQLSSHTSQGIISIIIFNVSPELSLHVQCVCAHTCVCAMYIWEKYDELHTIYKHIHISESPHVMLNYSYVYGYACVMYAHIYVFIV